MDLECMYVCMYVCMMHLCTSVCTGCGRLVINHGVVKDRM